MSTNFPNDICQKRKETSFNSCSARERVSQSSVGVPGKVPLWSGRHLELKYPSIFRDKRERKKMFPIQEKKKLDVKKQQIEEKNRKNRIH
ncbi:hypothetical protein CEXT_213271 [Caerostris extrusa]|uniref:Uncharacterized protein n=1 Tax=Caerostris extrusa TaxID=172846 RepID=A0AAV4NDI1_CAEEX|nr:hypothetical protein CEXT_213271 [Caerostris extrusa]